jgi:hypothetical protein
MARDTGTPVPLQKFSGKYTHRIISGASGTICLKKRRTLLPKPLPTLPKLDRGWPSERLLEFAEEFRIPQNAPTNDEPGRLNDEHPR